MKCLIFAEFSSSGGTRSFLKDLLAIHHNHNISTEVVFPSFISDPEIIHFIESKNFSYTTVPDRKAIFRKSYFSLIYEFYYYYRIINRFKPDLVVVSTATPGENISCFISKIPSIYILHTPANPTTLINRLMLKIPAQFSGARKKIYAVSEFVKQSVLTNWKVQSQHLQVIYNSYRLNNSLINGTGKLKFILTLGHVVSYKNPFLWFEIAKQVTKLNKNVEFLWLGDGELLPFFQEKTASFERINFVGHKNHVEEYYEKAYIYLQPSIKESLGISVLDAMIAGIPTIVSDAEGLPETTDHNISGFICYKNTTEEYVSYIQLLLNNDGCHAEMSRNAKKQAELIFSPRIQQEKILELYKLVTNC